MFVFQRLGNEEWGKLGACTHCCNRLCIAWPLQICLFTWKMKKSFHLPCAKSRGFSEKSARRDPSLWWQLPCVAVLTASLARGWSSLKKYVLWRSIRERLISGKEVLSRCNSTDKVSQNTDRAGPGVWAECEAGLLQGGSESPFWQPVLPTHLQRKQS